MRSGRKSISRREELAREPALCLCASARRTARLLTQVYDEALAPAKLQLNQFELIGLLLQRGPTSVSEIAEYMDFDQSTATRNVQTLVTLGFVEVAPSPGDRRLRLITVTARGTRRFERAYALWQDVQTTTLRRLGPRDVEHFHAVGRALSRQRS